MSSLKMPINLEALESELDEALRADELYKLRNDAKFRAIEQRVPTYDHFSDMVKAAHLKPLERSEMQKRAEVSWNHCYRCKGDELSPKCHGPSGAVDERASDETPEPKGSAEFTKAWSRLNGSRDRFEFLLRFGDRLKDKFFQAEVPAGFLEQFFRVGYEVCSRDTAPTIVCLLQTFAECARFSLSLTMIANKEHSQLLFERLLALASDDVNARAVKALAQTYSLILKA